MKKESSDAPPTKLTQLCGGLGIHVEKTTTYLDMKWPDTVKGWQLGWYYCKDIPMPDDTLGLPSYSRNRITSTSGWNPRLTKGEKLEVDLLVASMIGLKDQGLEGNDLMAAWVSRRIQPLQYRDRCTYTYQGNAAPIRVNPVDLTQDQFKEKMLHLTMVRYSIQMVGWVPPYDDDHLPAVVCDLTASI